MRLIVRYFFWREAKFEEETVDDKSVPLVPFKEPFVEWFKLSATNKRFELMQLTAKSNKMFKNTEKHNQAGFIFISKVESLPS